MTVLCCLTPPVIADLIAQAQFRVAYAAPGVAQDVAAKLVDAHHRLGAGTTRTVIDLDPELARLGYGEFAAIEMLEEMGVPIAKAPGLRIGLLIIDDAGWVFSLPPLLVEDKRARADEPNAVRVTAEQVDLLLTATGAGSSAQARNGAAASPELSFGGARLTVPLSPGSPLGADLAGASDIDRVRGDLERSPPQRFDLARRVRVFNAFFEFVELELRGLQVQRHRVALPSVLLRSFGEAKTRERIEATFKLVERSSVAGGTALEKKVSELRSRFLAQVPGFGRVVLRSRRASLDAEIDVLRNELAQHQERVARDLAAEIARSKHQLTDDLAVSIHANPPPELRDKVSDKPSLDVCRRYVSDKLNRIFPTAEKLIQGMALTYVVKGITHETLTDPEFQRKLLPFPMRIWRHRCASSMP